jgi:hypothetical protein
VRDYEGLLKQLLKDYFYYDKNEVHWAWKEGIPVGDSNEELNDQLFEIMWEMGYE